MPINFIFKLLTSATVVNIWLVDQLDMKVEGVIKVKSAAKQEKGERYWREITDSGRVSTST